MGKNDHLLNRAIVVMAIAALGTTALVVRRELAPMPPPPKYDRPQHVDEWQSFLKGGNRVGPADAPVTIIEFSDFQCEFCKAHAARLDRLRQAHPGQVAILFRHYPVTERHPYAYNATHTHITRPLPRSALASRVGSKRIEPCSSATRTGSAEWRGASSPAKRRCRI